MKPMQIGPVRCDGIGKKPGAVIAEEKIDGHRGLMHIGGELDRMYLTGRGISVHTKEYTERGLNVPHLNAAHEIAKKAGLGYTILDGEGVMSGQPFEHVQSVMGGLPETGIAFQEKHGPLTYRVFDALIVDGKDIRALPLRQRHAGVYRLLQMLTGACNIERVRWNENCTLDEMYERVVAEGGEGTVEKDLDAAYGVGWRKRKKAMTFDVVVMGFTQGVGKFKQMVGAVQFGAFIDGKLTSVGQCSGMSDGRVDWKGGAPNRDGSWIELLSGAQPEGTRAWFTANQHTLVGRVIEVKANGVTKHGALRHPQFVRVRNDKDAAQCGRPTEQRTSHE